MELFRRYGNLLRFDGTNQLQRTLPSLETDYILPDERDLSNLISYAQKLATEIRYYNFSGQAGSDWRPLFESLLDPNTGRVFDQQTLERKLESRKDWPPHLALLLVFLKLFQFLQADLNELPQRHLRYYYETCLGLVRRSAKADEVHLIFELARNAAAVHLPAGTLLDAGKDSEGQPLKYATTSDLIVSTASVVDIRRTVREIDRRGNQRFFIANAIAESETESWSTFGSPQLGLDASQRTMTEAELGFAIASPVLMLAEGLRRIEINAVLKAHNVEDLPSTQRIESKLNLSLSGAEGWVTPDHASVELINSSGNLNLNLELTISETAPALVPFESELHGAGPVSEWPVLRCQIKGESGIYETLNGLSLESATIKVDVKGVRNLIVQNAAGALSVDKPMPLFGNQPRIGSPFYIGSAEIFSKKLSYLAFNLDWEALPEDLFEHYRAYFDSSGPGLYEDFHSYFRFDVDMLYNRSWNHRLLTRQFLFSPFVTDTQQVAAHSSTFNSAFEDDEEYQALPNLKIVPPYGPGSQHGFVRLTLENPKRNTFDSYTNIPFEAFGHQAFSRRYANQAIALSRWEEASGVPEPELPNEPYTPVLASLALDYIAEAEVEPASVHKPGALYVIGPFGYSKADASVPANLVPDIKGQAAFYLGIKNLETPGNLSLLFQVDSGTASDANVLKPGETQWSYLAGEVWKSLPATAILNDSTYGFQKPGLVVVSVPKEATPQHTAMPNNLVWLRAHIEKPSNSASRTMALHSQAVHAELAVAEEELENYAKHLENGLAAETVNRLIPANAKIRKVTQPWPSVNGKDKENDSSYFRRCSERLRHRNRAVTPWDFERLVLEKFPEIFKVKCLPHTDSDGISKAGDLALVIVPDLRSLETSNQLEPRAGEVLMGQINDFVKNNLSSTYSSVHIIHPVYERLRVDIHVAFQAGLDAGWYTNLLNEELLQFLSPWAYKQGEDIVFGARIYKSEILAFLEGREYIDYVTDFRLYHSYDGPPRDGIGNLSIDMDFIIKPNPKPAIKQMIVGTDFVVGRSVEVAHGTQPHAILVSHPTHLITPISIGEDRCSGVSQLGIGYMTVGLDLEVQVEYT